MKTLILTRDDVTRILTMDVAVPAVEAAFAATVDRFGRLDILVCNSGGPPEGRAVDTTEETWDWAIQLALTFFIRMSREAVPHLSTPTINSIECSPRQQHSSAAYMNLRLRTRPWTISSVTSTPGHPYGLRRPLLCGSQTANWSSKSSKMP